MEKTILVSGSVVYDRIMNFPGKFREHIMPDKIHVINLSFQVETLEERFGGVAGNIAYTLKLLGCEPKVCASVGDDFETYKKHFQENGIDTQYITELPDTITAFANIINDLDDNQITAFYPGSLLEGAVPETLPKVEFAIVGPEPKETMFSWVKRLQKEKIPFMFDPGQQMTSFTGEDLRACLHGAEVVIGNDYEIGLLLRKTGLAVSEVLQSARMLVVTYGDKGSRIYTGEDVYEIEPIAPKKFIDPTGAGDAYRAGFVCGMLEGKSLPECGRFSSWTASKAIEYYGAQEHRFSREDFV